MKYNIDSVKAQHAAGTVRYIFFWGHQPEKDGSVGKGCFSQWWLSPFEHEHVTYASAEHWMMACKARLFRDFETLPKILSAKTPAEAKKLGREVQNFDDALWDQHKYAYVLQGNLLKFGQNPALKVFLLGTGERVLVEASPYDRVWGIGLATSAKYI